MAIKRFKPIELHTLHPEDIFQNYKLEISKGIIDAIDFGLRNNKKKINFAHIIIKKTLVITLSIDHREFLDLIEQNIENLVEFEEYEHCALAVKLKKKINKKLQKDELQLQESGSSKAN